MHLTGPQSRMSMTARCLPVACSSHAFFHKAEQEVWRLHNSLKAAVCFCASVGTVLHLFWPWRLAGPCQGSAAAWTTTYALSRGKICFRADRHAGYGFQMFGASEASAPRGVLAGALHGVIGDSSIPVRQVRMHGAHLQALPSSGCILPIFLLLCKSRKRSSAIC